MSLTFMICVTNFLRALSPTKFH